MPSDLTDPQVRVKLVGVSNYPDVARLTVGAQVMVEHEPDNAYDPNAFKVTLDGAMVGYLPAAIARRLITQDTSRTFVGHVTFITEHDGNTVGGGIAFDSPIGTRYLTEETPMARIPQHLLDQGADRYEKNEGGYLRRPYALPSNTRVVVIPLTDYADVDSNGIQVHGDWYADRMVKAMGGFKVPGEPEPVSVPVQHNEFPAADTIILPNGKVRWVTDPILERCLPGTFETRRPKDAADDWKPPRHTRPKETMYFNCVLVEGMLEKKAERAKYNPKAGSHIILAISSQWAKAWQQSMQLLRRRDKDFTPAGIRWELEISGSELGNMTFRSDIVDGAPVELPQPINLDDYFAARRAEMEAWVKALDATTGALSTSSPVDDVPPVATTDADEEAVDAFEANLEQPATAIDWTLENTARKKKLLLGAGVKVAPGISDEDIDALVLQNEARILELLATSAA